MNAPLLYKKNKEEVYNDLISLAKQYAPEWNTGGQQDVGDVLVKIYADMLEGTLSRVNKMLYKNYIYFLNIIGADTLPAVCAKGYASVKLSGGTPENVYVKKGSRLYSQSGHGQRIIYETRDDFFAIDNDVDSIYCVNSDDSKIALAYEKGKTRSVFNLFDLNNDNNLQKFRIFISSENVLTVSENSEITVSVIHNEKKYMEEIAAKFLGGENAVWECSAEDGWQRAESAEVVSNNIILKFGCKTGVASANGVEGNFIRCTILSKPKDEDILFTEVRLSSKDENLRPQYMYNNDLQIPDDEILPFGREFSAYDDFYINCDTAFNKKGSVIQINMDIGHIKADSPEHVKQNKIKWNFIMKESDIREPERLPVDIESVVWEYWNGNGWARLFKNNEYKDIFFGQDNSNVKITFECPRDIQSLIIGAYEGMWIRGRITSVSNLFESERYYNVPVINDIKINYSYRKKAQPANVFIIEKNLDTHAVDISGNEEINLFKAIGAGAPTAYFALENGIKDGPVKIFFHNAISSESNMPAINWEYYGVKNGKMQWIKIKLMDETGFFAKSGLITFIISEPMEKLSIFSKECFWIRAVNTDGSHEGDCVKKPCLKGIYFNTVSIIQRERAESEYFFIEPKQEDKIIQLAGNNIVNCSVWVNEIETLIADERNSFSSSNKDVQIIRDDSGTISEYWVRWKKVKSFSGCTEYDRVYRINEKSGRILFGNGRQGKIPFSLEEPSIKVDYCVTLGEQGNCGPGEIVDFVDSVPFADSVFNAEAIGGGCDVESAEAAEQRCSKNISVLNRAVSQSDFAAIAYEADRNAEKVKVLHDNTKSANVRIIILPKDIKRGETYFSEIKNNVLSEIINKAPVTMAAGNKISVEQAVYAEISVRIHIMVESYNDYQEVYKSVEESLEKFLDPISGGNDGKGFNIGEMPSKTKIYNIIKKIEKIKSIDSIHINCFEIINGERTEINYSTAEAAGVCVPVNGKHEIYIDVI